MSIRFQVQILRALHRTFVHKLYAQLLAYNVQSDTCTSWCQRKYQYRGQRSFNCEYFGIHELLGGIYPPSPESRILLPVVLVINLKYKKMPRFQSKSDQYFVFVLNPRRISILMRVGVCGLDAWKEDSSEVVDSAGMFIQ